MRKTGFVLYKGLRYNHEVYDSFCCRIFCNLVSCVCVCVCARALAYLAWWYMIVKWSVIRKTGFAIVQEAEV